MLVVDIDAPEPIEPDLPVLPTADSPAAVRPLLSEEECAGLQLAQMTGLKIVVCSSSPRATVMRLLKSHMVEAQVVTGHEATVGCNASDKHGACAVRNALVAQNAVTGGSELDLSGTRGARGTLADDGSSDPCNLLSTCEAPALRSEFSTLSTRLARDPDLSLHYAASVAELAYENGLTPRMVGVIATRPCDVELALTFGVTFALEDAGTTVMRAADARFTRREQGGLESALRSIIDLADHP